MKWPTLAEKIFEREILSVDASTLAYGAPPTAKERYLTLMEENPELLQDVPLKYLAFILVYYPTIIKSDTCRAKKKRLNENIKNYNKNYADLYSQTGQSVGCINLHNYAEQR